jgi:hypothetical protein
LSENEFVISKSAFQFSFWTIQATPPASRQIQNLKDKVFVVDPLGSSLDANVAVTRRQPRQRVDFHQLWVARYVQANIHTRDVEGS